MDKYNGFKDGDTVYDTKYNETITFNTGRDGWIARFDPKRFWIVLPAKPRLFSPTKSHSGSPLPPEKHKEVKWVLFGKGNHWWYAPAVYYPRDFKGIITGITQGA